MVRLSEPLISRVVVWKQLHLNQWFETTLRKGWRAIEGDVCKPEGYCTSCELLTAVRCNAVQIGEIPAFRRNTSHPSA
jgi:hypothetical protein